MSYSAPGVASDAVAKATRYQERRRENATLGAAVSAYAGGGAASYGAMRVGRRAQVRAKANEVKLQNAAPSTRKYAKAQNLADRGATPGERAAARGMADKLKAKAESERKAARRSIKGYRTTKALTRLSNPKTALAVGFGGTAAAGGTVGAALTRKPKSRVRKRDYSQAQANWERRARRANRVENTGQTVAGTAGAALGGAALRDAAFKDYPGFKARSEARAAKLPKKIATPLVQGKPGFKVLATAAGGTVVAATGTRSKNIAERKARRYEQMSKSFGHEPGSLMHAHDVEIAKAMSNRELSNRKKVQSATTIAGSTLGLGALGALGGAKLLPKATKLGKTPRGQAYARHLDRAATQLSIGAGGIGGVGGYNFAAIQRAEANKVAKPKKP